MAHRTLYALIKTGVHGSNGLNPCISYRKYQAYVIPRLLYSLDVMSLSDTHINQLQRFHFSTFRRMQSLPARTALSVIQLLLGALPIIIIIIIIITSLFIEDYIISTCKYLSNIWSS